VFYSDSIASISTTATMIDMSGITTGATVVTRLGSRIFVKDVLLDLAFIGGQSNLATDDNRNLLRVAIVDSVYPATGTFNVSALLDSREMLGVTHTYYDRLMELNSPGADSTGYMPAGASLKCIVPINRSYKFVGNGAHNCWPISLQFWIVSDSTAVSHPGAVAGNVTMRFIDA